jgi:hypothetical protein
VYTDRRTDCNAKTALQRTSRCEAARSSYRLRAEVGDVSRRPTRETIAFAVALVAIATLGGIAAAGVAGATPAAAAASDVVDAPNGSIDYDGERLVVERATGQQIAGTTNLENGSQVTIRVQSSDSQQPFLRSAVATVQPDGSFATTFDFEDVDRGVAFSVSVRYNGTELASAPGVVGGCDPTCGEPVGDAAFDRNLWQANAGDEIELTVTMTDRDGAFVRVGEDDSAVTIPFTVTDGNGDGTVTVVLRTAVEASDDPGVSAVASADSVRVHEDFERPRTLDPADYDVALYPSADASQRDGFDVGTVVVNEPTDDPATTRGGDSTTAGTIYGSASTSAPGGDGGVSMETIGVLAVGGVLAIVGVAALVGAFD